MKLTRRILASVIALIMVMLMLPTAMAAESNVYVLDSTADLTACEKGAKADGETEVVNDYFTIHYSEKTKIDSSKKSFEDGYEATQRLNFGGKVAFGDTVKNVVEINTSGTASVKLWWVANKDGREMGIFNASGEVLQETAVGSLANALYISELSVAEAGKYYIGSTSPDGCNYIFKIEVTEAGAETPVEPPVEPSEPTEPETPAYTGYLQFLNAEYTVGNVGLCPFAIDGPGTYTVSWDMYEGYSANTICYLYIEIDNAYAELTAAGYTVKDVKLSIDGNEIPVNQDYVWVYASTVEGQTNDYVIELYNVFGFSGPLYNMGAAIDVTNFEVKENITVTFTLVDPNAPVEPEKPAEPQKLTVAEAIALAPTADAETKYILTGVVKEIQNDTWGNMIIEDETGSILIYGTYSADGSIRYDALETKPAVGDTVTVLGALSTYKETPQMKNGALQELKPAEKPVEPDPVVPAEPQKITITEAIALAPEAAADAKYILTGTVKEIQNETWGNIIIEDETGATILIYGTYSADGSVRYDALETKPAVGDTVTLVGTLSTYKGTPQMKNGALQELKPAEPEKPNPGTGDPMALVMMVSLLSGSALAVLSLKKKEN